MRGVRTHDCYVVARCRWWATGCAASGPTTATSWPDVVGGQLDARRPDPRLLRRVPRSGDTPKAAAHCAAACASAAFPDRATRRKRQLTAQQPAPAPRSQIGRHAESGRSTRQDLPPRRQLLPSPWRTRQGRRGKTFHPDASCCPRLGVLGKVDAARPSTPTPVAAPPRYGGVLDATSTWAWLAVVSCPAAVWGGAGRHVNLGLVGSC